MDDDATLVQRVLAGDTGAYGALVQRWGACIIDLCLLRVRRPDVAEDLAQETLARGFEHLPSLGDPSRFRPWLGGIAWNVCGDWLASQRHAPVPLGDHDPVDQAAPGPLSQLSQDEQQGCLLAAVDSLPDELREVLLLYYSGEGHRYRDVAEMLGVSSATVNARLTQARALLRERLGDGCHGC